MYVELHARSAFSFLEGASTPEALIAACAAYGMPSMALLDRDGLYGAPRFYLAAKKTGLQAHIGAEVSCVGGWRYPLLVAIQQGYQDRKSTRLNSSHSQISYAVFCLKKKKLQAQTPAVNADPKVACDETIHV